MINIFKQQNSGLIQEWIENLSPLTKEERESVIRQRASVISAVGLTVEEAINAVEQEFANRERQQNVQIHQKPVAQIQEQVSFPSHVISGVMPQSQPFFLPEQPNQNEQIEQSETIIQTPQEEQRPQVRFQEDQRQTQVSSGKKTLKDRVVVTNVDGIKDTKAKTSNITQRNRGTGVMQQTDAVEFKWNPNEVKDRFSLKDYKRPTNSLADRFGPSVEELQNNLPSESDLIQNSDNQVMPRKFHMGKSLDQPVSRLVSDHVATVGFKSKGNMKQSNESFLRRQKNLEDM